MKKLLSILSICLVFVSCTSTPEEIAEEAPIRLLVDELINKGTKESPIMYFEGKLFTGVAFDVYSEGQLKFEGTYKDGKEDGLYQYWYENGQLRFKVTSKDGKEDGLFQYWYENGQLKFERTYKDGKKNGLYQRWDENGALIEQSNWKNGFLQ